MRPPLLWPTTMIGMKDALCCSVSPSRLIMQSRAEWSGYIFYLPLGLIPPQPDWHVGGVVSTNICYSAVWMVFGDGGTSSSLAWRSPSKEKEEEEMMMSSGDKFTIFFPYATEETQMIVIWMTRNCFSVWIRYLPQRPSTWIECVRSTRVVHSLLLNRHEHHHRHHRLDWTSPSPRREGERERHRVWPRII